MSRSIMIIDIETQNHPYYGSVASPYCPDNYVVESAYRIDRTADDGSVTVGDVFSVRFNSKEEFLADAASAHTWFDIPEDCWLIVAHNASYEISWFLSYNRKHFEDFLKRGGRVFCTLHGHYIVSDFQDQYPSLDETAPKYGGTPKVDGVKILWEQGVLTADIDPVLLHDYLVNGDIPNTALCFYGETAVMQERGQMQAVWERMDAMLAWAYCEFNGMYVNMPVAQANQAAQEAEIVRLKAALQEYLPELPEELEFNFGSDYHMSALVYGGSVKYQERVPYDPPQYVKDDFYHLTNGVSVKVSEVAEEALCSKNFVRYKAGRNKGQVKVFREDTEVEKLRWSDAIFKFPGIVNIKELPEHCREKYEDRGEFVGARVLPCGTPVYSTGTDAVNMLSKQGFEFASLITDLAALEKDTGTYYLRHIYNKDGSLKKTAGMLQYVIPNSEDGSGIVHHRLNTSASVTGRLTSSSPNLQNLPRPDEDDSGEAKSKVKQMFTSRYGPQGYISEVDYSALEVVMGCVHTGDRKLLALLQAGTDMHCYRLAFKEGVTYEEAYDRCHNKQHPLNKVWKVLRSHIKQPSFA